MNPTLTTAVVLNNAEFASHHSTWTIHTLSTVVSDGAVIVGSTVHHHYTRTCNTLPHIGMSRQRRTSRSKKGQRGYRGPKWV